MDYEKKYKEALVDIQELYNSMKYMSSTDALHTTTALERAFPELVKSKDEKIRNVIILIIKGIRANVFEEQGITKEDVITYLEKQGEQNVSIVDFKAKDWYVSKVDGKIHNMTYDTDLKLNQSSKNNMTQQEKIDKLKYLADTMYYSMQNLTTDTTKIREAMNNYRQFVISELKESEL